MRNRRPILLLYSCTVPVPHLTFTNAILPHHSHTLESVAVDIEHRHGPQHEVQTHYVHSTRLHWCWLKVVQQLTPSVSLYRECSRFMDIALHRRNMHVEHRCVCALCRVVVAVTFGPKNKNALICDGEKNS